MKKTLSEVQLRLILTGHVKLNMVIFAFCEFPQTHFQFTFAEEISDHSYH